MVNIGSLGSEPIMQVVVFKKELFQRAPFFMQLNI